jgi:hypothetical protein
MKVYEERDSILVKGEHGGDDTCYRIFYGTVNWERTSGGKGTAFTVLMQYGTTREWSKAKKKGEISFDMPAHILENDLAAVLEALQELADRNGVDTSTQDAV